LKTTILVQEEYAVYNLIDISSINYGNGKATLTVEFDFRGIEGMVKEKVEDELQKVAYYKLVRGMQKEAEG